MSFAKCAYFKCNQTSRDTSLFRFPVKDEGRLLLWIRNSGNIYLNILTRAELECRRICAKHFKPDSIHKGKKRSRLIGPAIPFRFQEIETKPSPLEIDRIPSPEVLKVKIPQKFYRNRSRFARSERESVTNEDVIEQKLSMKKTLSVNPMQCNFISDTHDSSIVTVKEEAIFIKKEKTEEEEFFVETVFSENNSQVTVEEIFVKEEDIAEPLVETEAERCDIKIEYIKEESDHDTFTEVPAVRDEQPKLKKTYCCDICSRTFSLRRKLKLHMWQSHNRQMLHSCDWCDNEFSAKSFLEKHLRVHTGEKPFACDICRKTYKYKGDLTRHTIVHTKMLYACDKCGKEFKRKHYLAIHVKEHTGGNPCACKCGKTFMDTYLLKIHKRIHTGEMPYTCKICDKTFCYKSVFSRHIKTLHAAGEKT